MASAVQKIKLSPSRDIPFNKLMLSQSNVRRVKAGVSIEQLAESIAHRTLLQSLSVRAVVDADGQETGMFEVPAGGRRYRALELLVKQKRMAKTQPVPCVVRDSGIAEDDSLAENDERVGLHPLDQFRAFQSLRDGGMSEEEIAARHFVTPAIVKQRLRLASVSPKLHEVYADDGMTLEQLMAFSVTADQARQEQIWDNVSRSQLDEPYQIRRMLTENTVRASDRRAQFIGLDTYEQAGGAVMRDLFEHDDGGWLRDVPLLDRLVTEKLKTDAEAIAAEGWKWIAVAVDFPYGHTNGLRELDGEPVDLTEEERATFDALNAEYAKIEEDYQDADELPDEIDQRLGEIEAARSVFEARSLVYDPTEIARAGVFVSVDALALKSKSERGYDLTAAKTELAVQGQNIILQRGISTVDAFRIIGRSILRQLAANEPAVRESDPKGLHQMRVGLRRLRAAISVFSEFLGDKQTERIKGELKWLTGKLGPARDLDVMGTKIKQLRKAAPAKRALKEFSAELAVQRTNAFAKAKDAVNSTRYRSLLLDALQWIEAGDWAKQPSIASGHPRIEQFAKDVLTRRSKKAMKKANEFEQLDPHQRHKLRIAIKKLRYSTDFFYSLFSGRKMNAHLSGFKDRLKDLQDCLGVLNDIVVRQKLAPKIAVGSERTKRRARTLSAGAAFGREQTEIEPLLKAAAKAARKFAHAKRFWT